MCVGGVLPSVITLKCNIITRFITIRSRHKRESGRVRACEKKLQVKILLWYMRVDVDVEGKKRNR